MAGKKKVGRRTLPRGEIRRRVINEVAVTRARGVSRRDIAEAVSQALASEGYAVGPETVSRVAGKLIEKGDLGERVVLNGPQVGLHGRALISVALGISDLRIMNHKKDRKITQEALVEIILEKTNEWALKNNDGEPRLVLLDAKVVQAAPFHILLTLIFKDNHVLSEYTTKVVHRIPFVVESRAMLVSYSRAYRGDGTSTELKELDEAVSTLRELMKEREDKRSTAELLKEVLEAIGQLEKRLAKRRAPAPKPTH